MRFFLFLSLVLFQATTGYGVDSKDREQENEYSICRPPKEVVFKEKFKDWFLTESLERELKEVVNFADNYERREKVKNFHRVLYFADRFREEEIRTRMRQVFLEMANADLRRQGIMQDFPIKGSNSQLGAGDDGTLELSAHSFPEVEQNFLSPKIRSKLGNSVRVNYHYPIDRFEYSLVYDGKEYPLKEVVQKLQDDWELECVEFANRQKQYLENKSNASGGSSQ